LKENAVNLSAWSRADLIRELLSLPATPSVPAAPRVSDSARPLHEGELARRLAVARELLLRDLHERMRGEPVMDSPQVVRDWLRLHCGNLEREVFLVLHLDARHHLIEAEELFRGTLTQTSVYPREVVKAALARNAAALILAHNHPSGSVEASRADEQLTEALKAALGLVEVAVLDHFVVAGNEVISFAERGLL